MQHSEVLIILKRLKLIASEASKSGLRSRTLQIHLEISIDFRVGGKVNYPHSSRCQTRVSAMLHNRSSTFCCCCTWLTLNFLIVDISDFRPKLAFPDQNLSIFRTEVLKRDGKIPWNFPFLRISPQFVCLCFGRNEPLPLPLIDILKIKDP